MSIIASPKKPAGNKLFNLKDVVNFPNKIASTIGVILDCTGTYRTDDSFDYVTKLRVIDNHYHPKNKVALNTESTVYIFIYTKNEAEAPKIKNIGDIILLRNFIFDNYSIKGGNIVRGNYNKSCSEWQIFDGRTNNVVQNIGKSRSIPSKVFGEEIEQIRKLRDWLNTYFINYGLLELSWYQSEFPDMILNENVYELKDVDIMVKIIAVVKTVVNGLIYHKLVFVDDKKQLYFAELQKTGVEFQTSKVVKLRSVCIYLHNNSRKIDFFNYSSITFIPSHFKDSKDITRKTQDVKFSTNDLENQFFEELHLEKYTKKQMGSNIFVFTSSNDRKAKNIKNQITDSYPELEHYDLSSVELPNKKKALKMGSRIGSVVLSKYQSLETTSLNRISEILLRCAKSPTECSKLKNEKFKIRVQIDGIDSLQVKSFAKLYSASTSKIWDISEYDLAKLTSTDVKVIFYNHFIVKEKSAGNSPGVPIHLATYDGNPENIFHLWKEVPDISDLPSWIKMSAKKEKAIKELIKNLFNPETEYDFVVELLTNAENKVYFRIVDSLFWFQNI